MRYFLFTYNQTTDTSLLTGNLYFSMENFPSHKLLKESAQDKTGDHENNVIFTSWNEFKSEEDFNNFMGEELDLSTPQSEE